MCISENKQTQTQKFNLFSRNLPKYYIQLEDLPKNI